MNRLLPFTASLLAFNQAEAHSHPGIDSLTHSLEHLAISNSQWLPYFAAAMLSLALTLGIRKWRKVQARRSEK